MNPTTCGNNCDCETLILSSNQIKQGQYAMCWFVSLLNTLLLSDRLSSILKPYINTSAILQLCQNPDIIASHLLNEVSNKPCLAPTCTIDTIINVAKYTIHTEVFREILHEYFSDNPTSFGPENISGGYSARVIMPYLVRLGFPSCNIKHCVFNVDNVYRNLFTDPRQIKLVRLCHEYLENIYKCNKNVEIFILSIAESLSMEFDDIRNKRDNLYLGKFICFIDNGKLFVYKLDAALLSSNNSIFKNMGHAISAITCKNHGFIVNSYDPVNINHKTCSLFNYDWYKWESNRYFYHTIEQNHTCTGGHMISANPTSFNIFTSKKAEFTYNRNIGNNSMIYVRSIHTLTLDNTIESLHTTHRYNTPRHIDEQNTYKYFLKPYFYLLNEISGFNNIKGIIYEFSGYFPNITFSLANSILIQKGIIKNGMNMYGYKITIPMQYYYPDFSKLIQECMPDDITIIQNISNPNQYGLYVQYFRNIMNPKLPIGLVHGGIDNLYQDQQNKNKRYSKTKKTRKNKQK